MHNCGNLKLSICGNFKCHRNVSAESFELFSCLVVRKAFTKDETEKMKLEGENYFITAKMGSGNACIIFMFNNLCIRQKSWPGC